MRQLYVARRLAVATSTSCVACAKSMLTTAPSALRERFRGRERPKDLMPLLARGRKAGDALEESVLASLRSVAAVWKEARSQVESLDERIRALLEANAPALLGVEGTASYGAGLTRRLVELGYNVVEVLRPKRDKVRPGEGKSDPLDAERAARKAASGRGCSVPKSQDGWVEVLALL